MKAIFSECGDCDSCCFGTLCKKHSFDKALPGFVKNLEKKRIYHKGDILFRQEEYVGAFMALRRGVVKLYDDNHHLQNLFISGQLVNGFEMNYESEGYYAVAASYSEVCILSKESVHALSQLTMDFTSDIIALLSGAISDSQKIMSIIRKNDAREKVGAFIALLYLKIREINGNASQFEIPLNKKEMAFFLGLSVSTLIRAINNLSSEGLFDIFNKEIRINDIDALILYL